MHKHIRTSNWWINIIKLKLVQKASGSILRCQNFRFPFLLASSQFIADMGWLSLWMWLRHTPRCSQIPTHHKPQVAIWHGGTYMRKLIFGVDGSRIWVCMNWGSRVAARRGGLSSGVSVWYGCRSDGNRWQHQVWGESDGCPRSLRMSFPVSRRSYSNIFKH